MRSHLHGAAFRGAAAIVAVALIGATGALDPPPRPGAHVCHCPKAAHDCRCPVCSRLSHASAGAGSSASARSRGEAPSELAVQVAPACRMPEAADAPEDAPVFTLVTAAGPDPIAVESAVSSTAARPCRVACVPDVPPPRAALRG